jgi:hypothetical protein
MYLKVGNNRLPVSDDEVMAVALLSVLKWNAASLTDVIGHLYHYVQCKDGLENQRLKKIS